MSDLTQLGFNHSHRAVRLDTILRFRWLAALGQLAAIFIVAQGLDFEVPIIPCLTVVGISAALNLALQIVFNPVHRLEPPFAALLLAVNIAELAALLFLTGG
ncbi:MAG TPA: sensor histidine kinase, partial [Afipia sp.]